MCLSVASHINDVFLSLYLSSWLIYPEGKGGGHIISMSLHFFSISISQQYVYGLSSVFSSLEALLPTLKRECVCLQYMLPRFPLWRRHDSIGGGAVRVANVVSGVDFQPHSAPSLCNDGGHVSCMGPGMVRLHSAARSGIQRALKVRGSLHGVMKSSWLLIIFLWIELNWND